MPKSSLETKVEIRINVATCIFAVAVILSLFLT